METRSIVLTLIIILGFFTLVPSFGEAFALTASGTVYLVDRDGNTDTKANGFSACVYDENDLSTPLRTTNNQDACADVINSKYNIKNIQNNNPNSFKMFIQFVSDSSIVKVESTSTGLFKVQHTNPATISPANTWASYTLFTIDFSDVKISTAFWISNEIYDQRTFLMWSYFDNVDNVTIPKVTVRYFEGTWNFIRANTAYYISANNEITLQVERTENSHAGDAEYYLIVMHEYGHHVMHALMYDGHYNRIQVCPQEGHEFIKVSNIGCAWSEGFADNQYVSPRKQIASGVAPEDVQCREDRVLVLRTNGSPACVTEKSAERVGWKIIKNNVVDPINIVSSFVELEKIPNPTGYWIPIPEEDTEDFAKLFAKAAGDSLTGEMIDRVGNIQYRTEFGNIRITDYENVNYHLNGLVLEPNERKKFTENFMESMGFEYDAENAKTRDSRSYIWHTYSNEYSRVNFRFATYMDEIIISFSGWTNNPELVIFTFSEELAIQKAFDFVETLEELYISESDGGKCQIEIISKSHYLEKFVNSGIPYYKIQVGYCTHSMWELVSGDIGVYVYVDGLTGEDIFAKGIGLR